MKQSCIFFDSNFICNCFLRDEKDVYVVNCCSMIKRKKKIDKNILRKINIPIHLPIRNQSLTKETNKQF